MDTILVTYKTRKQNGKPISRKDCPMTGPIYHTLSRSGLFDTRRGEKIFIHHLFSQISHPSFSARTGSAATPLACLRNICLYRKKFATNLPDHSSYSGRSKIL